MIHGSAYWFSRPGGKWLKICQLVVSAAVCQMGSIGCDRGPSHGVSDGWVSLPPLGDRTAWEDAPKVSPFRYAEVPNSKKQEAFRMLEAVPYQELSRDTAARLAESDPESLPDGVATLVRGVCSNPGTGQFTVWILNGRLWVHHGSLGSSSDAQYPTAFVVVTDEQITEVYVSCSAAR